MNRFERVQQWLVFGRQWHLANAFGQDLDLFGARIARYLSGARKPIYHPEKDCGDHVVVYNCRHVAMKGFDWKHREYFFNKEYPKSKAFLPAWEIHQYDPCRLMFMSVYEHLDKNLTRRRHVERLHLFAEDEVSERILENVSNQIEQVQRVAKRADEYSEEERQRFPALFDFAPDHVVQWQHSQVHQLPPLPS